MDEQDAIAFLMAGATAVQVGTATFIDPFAIPKIIRGIGAYMEDHGIEHPEQIRGSARAQG
jgi:dihydroorotate dehydrogenase (NAD+) catalytic subunit